MKDLIGKNLGQYEIREKIGQGGMGLVYKAYQPTLDRFVAVKVLSPLLAEVPDFTARFQLEARAVARLSHPNIVPVYDSGIQANYNYIVMRYIPNSTTLSHLMKQPTSLTQMIEYVIQIAEALNYTHEQGVIHRDVKPSNILIDGKWALLTDFGLVKDQTEASRLTGSGNGIGTAAYMSPEQAKGSKIDHRTDIYALGVVLYEFLSGTIPHDATSPVGILVKRTTEPPVPLHLVNPNIPPSLEHVVMYALSADPDQRYSTASLLAEALRQVQHEIAPNFENRETLVFPQNLITKPAFSFITSRLPSKVTQKSLKFMIAGAAASVVVILLLILGLFTFGNELDQTEAQASSAGNRATTALLSSAETPSPIPLETPQAVMKAEVEVYSGPGDNYDLLGYLPAGARAEIVSQNKDRSWWHIKTSLGLNGLGWVKSQPSIQASYAEIVPIALAPPTPTLPATATSPPPTPEPSTQTPAPPSPTPQPPTSTPEPKVTPTPQTAATLTPTTPPVANLPAPTIIPIQGEFKLLKPDSFEKPSYGVTEFEWQWSAPLSENQGFEIRVWQDGEAPAGVHDAVADNKNGRIEALGNGVYHLTTDITETPGVQNRRGIYNWTVVLVQISPEYKDLGVQTAPGRFRFEPIQSGGHSDENKNSGGAFN